MPPVQPIIIRKKKVAAHGGGHHGGAWKVAYADFVTAMMAFFLVMWILGLSKASRTAIAVYFREPGIFKEMQGKTPVKIDSEAMVAIMDNEGRKTSGERKDGPDGKDGGSAAQRDEKKRIEELKEEIKEQMQEMAKAHPELADLPTSVSMTMTDEGLRVELSESEKLAFFKVGGSQVSKAARDVFGGIAQKLGKLPNKVDIEGHTDSRPYGDGSYSNWELSADRANAVRKVLGESGLEADQVGGVAGYADRKLRKGDAPFDVSNRRVSILVRFSQPQTGSSEAVPEKPPVAPAPTMKILEGHRTDTPRPDAPKDERQRTAERAGGSSIPIYNPMVAVDPGAPSTGGDKAAADGHDKPAAAAHH